MNRSLDSNMDTWMINIHSRISAAKRMALRNVNSEILAAAVQKYRG